MLLVTLDTTRADRIGCYGHAAAETPHLDRIAKEGVRFDHAYATVPLTLPSHSSLLSGLYPGSTDIHVNGSVALGKDVPTLGHWFRERGFRTGAFLSSWVLVSDWGLAHGFDHYDDDLDPGAEGPAESVQRLGNETVDAALAWLSRNDPEPFFAWVHLFDPHDPYEPPAPYKERLEDPYDGEIAFADAQIGRLLDWLKKRNIYEKTIIVVAGDHGEGLGHHGEAKHGLFIYDSTMRVPWVMSYSAKLPRGHVEDEWVSLVDLFPTLTDLISGDVPPRLDGRSLVKSLTTRDKSSVALYGESEYAQFGFGWASSRFVLLDQWKYIDTVRPELFDLSSDPGETTNVLDEHPDQVARLRKALMDTVARMTPRETDTGSMDAEALEKLESLGYVGGFEDEDDDTLRRDSKDMIDVLHAVEKSNTLVSQERYAEAIATLEPLTSRSPESIIIHGLLGRSYLQLGRFAEAEKSLVLSLRSLPNHTVRLCNLGDALQGLGRIDDAITTYEKVLETRDYAQAHSRLGLMYAQKGQFDRALVHSKRFVEMSPESPNARFNLANVYFGMGRSFDGVKELREAIELDAQCDRCHDALWRTLLSMGLRQDTISALRRAHDALPNDARFTYRLAWMLSTSALDRNGTEAVPIAETFCQQSPGTPACFDVLAVAWAAKGDFPQAIENAKKAIELLEASGQDLLRDQIVQRLAMYQAGQPYSE